MKNQQHMENIDLILKTINILISKQEKKKIKKEVIEEIGVIEERNAWKPEPIPRYRIDQKTGKIDLLTAEGEKYKKPFPAKSTSISKQLCNNQKENISEKESKLTLEEKNSMRARIEKTKKYKKTVFNEKKTSY